MNGDDGVVHFTKVNSILEIEAAQRERLRELARKDTSLACQQLQVMLRISSPHQIRRYVEEVLLGDADHAEWFAAHGRLPGMHERLVLVLGREFRDPEVAAIANITELSPAQVDVVREYCSKKAVLSAVQYLRTICPVSVTTATDYVEYVGSRAMAHEDWLARRLPSM